MEMEDDYFYMFKYLPEPEPNGKNTEFKNNETTKALDKIYRSSHLHYKSITESLSLNPRKCSEKIYKQLETNCLVEAYLNGEFITSISEEHRKLHTYITGSSGCGKSEAMKSMIWHYLTKKIDTAVVIIAPVSKFCQEIAKFRPNLYNDRLVYINPAIDDIHFPCLNPFEFDDIKEISIIEAERRAADFLEVFTELLKDNDAELSSQMTTILINILPVLMKWENATIYDLLCFLDKNKNQPYIQFAYNNFQDNSNLLEFLSILEKKDFDRTLSSLYSRIYNIFSSTVSQKFFIGLNCQTKCKIFLK